MSKTAIYGAGQFGESLWHAIEVNGIQTDFFIDQHTERKEVMGLPVFRIDQVQDKETTIYISVAPNPQDTAADTEIVENLQQLGFSNVYCFMQSVHAFPKFLRILAQQNLLWMSGQTKDMVDRQYIQKVKTLFHEEKSIRLLENIVAFREALSLETYIPPDNQVEYFPHDIDLFSSIDQLRFVDAGAYVGDTIRAAMSAFEERHQPVEYIISFEPDLQKAVRLSQEVQEQHQRHPDTRFFVNTSGLWSTNELLRFSKKGTSSSSISSNDDDDWNRIQIPATSLDCSLFAAQPNYIKMDIEGAEEKALLGSKNIISNQQPVLAICIYHKPADLWEIPLLIHQINPRYEMYLRVHGHMGLSTVLYCVPIQKA